MKKLTLIALALVLAFSTPTFAAQQEETILVGAIPDNIGTSYFDKDNKLTGFEVEVLREVDRRLPEYKFDFRTADFGSNFMALGAKKVRVILGNIQWNKERADKFLYTNETYYATPYKVVVKGSEKGITGLSDLGGKKVSLLGTGLQYQALEDYIKRHNINAEILPGKSTNEVVTLLTTGRADALFLPEFQAIVFSKYGGRDLRAVGKGLAPVGLKPEDVGAHFLLNKGDEKLRDRIDEALAGIRKDGTLAALSQQWFGQDFTKPIEVIQ